MSEADSLARIALDRRRRVRRGGAYALRRRVAIGHLKMVAIDRLAWWLVGLLGGVVRARHRIYVVSSTTPYMANGSRAFAVYPPPAVHAQPLISCIYARLAISGAGQPSSR